MQAKQNKLWVGLFVLKIWYANAGSMKCGHEGSYWQNPF